MPTRIRPQQAATARHARRGVPLRCALVSLVLLLAACGGLRPADGIDAHAQWTRALLDEQQDTALALLDTPSVGDRATFLDGVFKDLAFLRRNPAFRGVYPYPDLKLTGQQIEAGAEWVMGTTPACAYHSTAMLTPAGKIAGWHLDTPCRDPLPGIDLIRQARFIAPMGAGK